MREPGLSERFAGKKDFFPSLFRVCDIERGREEKEEHEVVLLGTARTGKSCCLKLAEWECDNIQNSSRADIWLVDEKSRELGAWRKEWRTEIWEEYEGMPWAPSS